MPKIPSAVVTTSDPKVTKEKRTKTLLDKKASKAVTNSVKKAVGGRKKDAKTERNTIYPAVEVRLFTGDTLLTADLAKELLGWEEVEGDVFDLKDYEGKKIRLFNNCHNRQFDKGLAKTWESEVLQGHWQLNGESIVVGKTGVIASGQHRLVAVVLASQEYAQNSERWPNWDGKGIPAVLVLGVNEDDATINTIDTGRPRSLTDVIYRSDIFVGLTGKDKAVAAKSTAFAIKFVAHRTAAWKHAYNPGTKRTHAESLDFLHRHERILDCVRFLFDEDKGKNAITKYQQLGTAAGLMYLMAAAKSDIDLYRNMDIPSEKGLDFELFEKASEFWVLLASGSSKLKPVKAALNKLIEDEAVSQDTRNALLVLAWSRFVEGHPVREEDITLKFHVDDDGIRRYLDCPSVGGIDLGNPKDDEKVDDDEVDAPDEQEVEAAKQAVTKAKTPKASKSKKAEGITADSVGKQVWAVDPKGEGHWCGELLEVYEGSAGPVARIKVGKKFAGAGKTFEHLASQVQLEKPTAD